MDTKKEELPVQDFDNNMKSSQIQKIKDNFELQKNFELL